MCVGMPALVHVQVHVHVNVSPALSIACAWWGWNVHLWLVDQSWGTCYRIWRHDDDEQLDVTASHITRYVKANQV